MKSARLVHLALSTAALTLVCHAAPAWSSEAAAAGTAVASSAGIGLATFARTAAALAAIVGLILGCGWLARRLGGQRRANGRAIKVIDAAPLGSRERLVLVEVDGVRLALGVGGGNVRHLATLVGNTVCADDTELGVHAQAAEPHTSAETPLASTTRPTLAEAFRIKLREAMRRGR